ncbi:MAG: hypothetical protein ACKOW1_02885 [Novosphingobium sp.]|jgi:hypothetical protein
MPEPKPWFAPKSHGYGAGWPIAWQGWALLGGYLAILAVVGWLDHQHDGRVRVIGFALFVSATAGFLVLVKRRTQGGWQWRWGKRD